ncbi:MAG: hypothetical protein M3P08_07415 [Thermoproteota archaeon]|nr:hypothetical protein [Thermoproteota archaeon]
MTLGFIAMACSTNYAFAQIPFLFPSNGSHAVTTNITKVSPTTAPNATATSVQVSRLNFSKASGNIASLQNNAYPWDPWHLQFSKNAIWVLSGKWNLLIANTTSSSLGSPVFNASFSMVRLNGTGLHKYLILDFKSTGAPRFNATDNSTKFSGTSTVTMKNGPVKDVPTNITMSANRTIRIALDPIKTARDFGWEAIYGVVTKVK